MRPTRPAIGVSAPAIDLAIDRAMDERAVDEPAAQRGEGRWRLADHRGRTVVLIFHRHIH
ncbi:MAG: hypothetical protein AAF547_13570 [Actinomycetota bacterium]